MVGVNANGDARHPGRDNLVPRRRAGFTMIEVVAAILIVAVVSAVIVPVVFARIKDARVTAITAEFYNLAAGVSAYRADVGRYPKNLTYLNSLPVSPTDVCDIALSAVNSGRFKGPYVNRTISLLNPVTMPRYVLSTGDSVEAVLTLVPSLGGQRVVQIWIYGPEADIADLVDIKIDGVAGASAGTLQYVDNGGAGVNLNMEKLLKFNIPIRAGDC
jgi:prepilin-type N-terminal cleavage/methylation domain-containing protein